jgi:dephospho-CoA kinase
VIKLGLTGSIASGKSTTAGFFRECGIPVFDADRAVHELYRNEAVEPVSRAFPESLSDGVIDRDKLKYILRKSPHRIKELEALVHPLVHKREETFLKKCQQKCHHIVVLDIPLLLETSGQGRVDAVIVVTCTRESQRKRLAERQTMDEATIQTILAKQMPVEDKARHAHWIVKSDFGLDHARQTIHSILKSVHFLVRGSLR